MGRFVQGTILAVVATYATLVPARQNGEAAASGAESQGDVVMVSLSNAVYPPLALQARIAGDVQIKVEVRKDGSLESASIVSGHQMLTQGALDSARQSKFECRSCKAEVTAQTLTYSYQLATHASSPGWPCPESRQATQITQSVNHITVVADPPSIIVDFTDISVRSAKCLYLWHCGREWGGKDYYYERVRSLKCLDLWSCGLRLREPFASCKKLHPSAGY
jgi:TonB family protein